MPQPVTITFTRYGEPDALVLELLDSLAGQTGVSGEVLFFDQAAGDPMAREVADRSTDDLRFDYRPLEPRSLSHARNAAIEAAEHDTILYVDADAVPAPDWAAALAGALACPDVGVAGGRICPRWHRPP